MSTSFKIVFTEDAKAASGESLAAVEELARREIVLAFGEWFDLERYFAKGSTHVDQFFWLPGIERTFIAWPHDAHTWEVGVIAQMKPEPKCPDYRIVFSKEARAVIRLLGWHEDSIRSRARCALKAAHPVDYGFCEFLVPIKEIAFKGCPLDKDTVQIELYDWGQEYLAM
jgi:hypothetical protein